MNGQVDISVIIPTYNCSSLLREAIGSCLAQQNVSFEILVVDDASTDDTRSVLASYGQPVRSILLDENHGNGCFPRNVGIEHARGRYIKFLDHDDILMAGSLARELATADREDADMVMSGWGWYSVDALGNVITDSSRIFAPPAPDDVIDALLENRKVPFTAAVLYRREYIKEMRWDKTVGFRDDLDWFCRNALKRGKLAVSPGLSYWWRLHGAAISARRDSGNAGLLEAATVENIIYGRIEELLRLRGLLTDKRKRDLARRYYATGLRAFCRFDKNKFNEVYGHILELCPGFRPDASTEYNGLIRLLCDLIGVKPTLMLYSVISMGMDKLSLRRKKKPNNRMRRKDISLYGHMGGK